MPVQNSSTQRLGNTPRLSADYLELVETARCLYPCDPLASLSLGQTRDPLQACTPQAHDSILYVHTGRVPPNVAGLFERKLRLLPGSVALPAKTFRPVLIAHALGHIVQGDPDLEETFGPVDLTFSIADTESKTYIDSDREMHAHYIAATLLGRTSVADTFGLVAPGYAPDDWTSWAETRRVS